MRVCNLRRYLFLGLLFDGDELPVPVRDLGVEGGHTILSVGEGGGRCKSLLVP